MKTVLGKLNILINENGEKSKIDILEETIVDEIGDSLREKSFYSLPINEILEIVKKSDISDTQKLKKTY